MTVVFQNKMIFTNNYITFGVVGISMGKGIVPEESHAKIHQNLETVIEEVMLLTHL